MSTDDENLYVSGKDLGRRRRAEKRNDRKEELPIATDFLSLSLSLSLCLSFFLPTSASLALGRAQTLYPGRRRTATTTSASATTTYDIRYGAGVLVWNMMTVQRVLIHCKWITLIFTKIIGVS